jgi:hypothetical protein
MGEALEASAILLRGLERGDIRTKVEVERCAYLGNVRHFYSNLQRGERTRALGSPANREYRKVGRFQHAGHLLGDACFEQRLARIIEL